MAYPSHVFSFKGLLGRLPELWNARDLGMLFYLASNEEIEVLIHKVDQQYEE